MTYKEALVFLDSFIDYEKIGYKSRNSFKLERMKGLARIFGNPQESFSSIHIAGTKGKGSIASFISSILKEAGFSVGLYTSPHLVDARERIKINDEIIKKDELAFQAGEIKRKLDGENLDFSPTFFEIYTILAFNYFRAKKIDFGVIETGLGGRLDATNIIKPVVAAISPVSYDHTNILGDNLQKIAVEKTGIIKKGCICVSSPQRGDALRAISDKCNTSGAELILIGKDIKFEEIGHDSEKEIFNIRGITGKYEACASHLIGRHQIANAACAVGIAEALKKRGAKIMVENIKNGIAGARNPGRCEVISKNPQTVLDGAQNRASASALCNTIKRNFNYERLILVLGISKGKDIKGVCDELAPLANTVILTKAGVERAEEPRSIERFIREKEVVLTDSVEAAVSRAQDLARPQDMILVTGSFYVIGEGKKCTDWRRWNTQMGADEKKKLAV